MYGRKLFIEIRTPIDQFGLLFLFQNFSFILEKPYSIQFFCLRHSFRDYIKKKLIENECNHEMAILNKENNRIGIFWYK